MSAEKKTPTLHDIEYQLLTDADELNVLLDGRQLDLHFKRQVHPDLFEPLVTFKLDGKDYVMPLVHVGAL